MPNNNITFGVNLLPSPTGTYALGSTTQKWKLYADEINGIAISMLSTSDHTHTLNLTQSSDTATINLTENTAYTLTAGGNSIIFKTPEDTDTKVIQKIKSDSKNYKLLLASDSPSNGEAAEAYYSAYTTLNPQSGTLTIGTSSGTGTLTASQYSGNAATASLADKATAANITSTQYGIAYYNNTSGTFASTSQGTSAQALIGGGTSAAPQFVSINTTLTNTAATANASQKLQVTVLGQSSSVVEFDKAATNLYGVTLLSNSFTSDTTRNTSITTAAHPNAIWNAIDSLDASAVGVAANVGNRFISQISEDNGIISATLSTANIGANNQPIFITDGVLTAANSGIGTSTRPIYMNTSGELTQCGALIQLNGTDITGTKASFYAPTTSGATGEILYYNTSPTWKEPSIKLGTQTKGIGMIANDNIFDARTLVLDLGLSNIFNYRGEIAYIPNDINPTNPQNGDVYIVNGTSNDGLYIYAAYPATSNTGEWQKIAFSAGYKVMQPSKSTPNASRPTSGRPSFINAITQDTNGVITATANYLPGTTICGTTALAGEDNWIDNNAGYWTQTITNINFYTTSTEIEAHVRILSNYTELKTALIIDTSIANNIVTMLFKLDKTNQPTAPASAINIEYSLHAIYEG